MQNKTIAGIIAIIFGIFLLVLFILSKVQRVIKIRKLKYKETKGKVIKSINTSTPEYMNKKNEEYFNKHNGARKVYNILENIFPTSTDDKYRGSVYASIIQYEVDNKKYETISEFSSDKKEKKGKVYKVRYNPVNPEESFIVNDRGKVILLILIIILLGIGFKLLFF